MHFLMHGDVHIGALVCVRSHARRRDHAMHSGAAERDYLCQSLSAVKDVCELLDDSLAEQQSRARVLELHDELSPVLQARDIAEISPGYRRDIAELSPR